MSIAYGGGPLGAEDLDRASRDAGIRDRAIAWYRKAEPEIAALAGYEATAAEKAFAQVVIAAETAARMYGDVRKEFGGPTARELMKGFFAVLDGVMRRNGEPIHMRVTADFSEVAATEPDTPLCEDDGKPCDCELDQDGRCSYCIETFRVLCAKTAESVRVLGEADISHRKRCRPCIRRHFDAAMAEFVRRDLSKFDRNSAEAMMRTVFMTSQTLQAMPMPLTLKAWNEIVKGAMG